MRAEGILFREIAFRDPRNPLERDSSLRVGNLRIRRDEANLYTVRVYHLELKIFHIYLVFYTVNTESCVAIYRF